MDLAGSGLLQSPLIFISIHTDRKTIRNPALETIKPFNIKVGPSVQSFVKNANNSSCGKRPIMRNAPIIATLIPIAIIVNQKSTCQNFRRLGLSDELKIRLQPVPALMTAFMKWPPDGALHLSIYDRQNTRSYTFEFANLCKRIQSGQPTRKRLKRYASKPARIVHNIVLTQFVATRY